MNLYLDDQEEELRLRGNVPSDGWWHGYLREQAPGYALARRWAGIEQEAAALRAEIARLRLLVREQLRIFGPQARTATPSGCCAR